MADFLDISLLAVNLQVLTKLNDFWECFRTFCTFINGVTNVNFQMLDEISLGCVGAVAVGALVGFLKDTKYFLLSFHLILSFEK